MQRYILIDNYSGYVWGDSSDLNGAVFTGTIEEYAAALDKSIDASAAVDRSYVMQTRPDADEQGYLIYLADADGGDSFPVMQNGQDDETIEAIRRDCKYLGFLRFVPSEE